jgi:SOS-response transcriptional repressor LexA
MHNLVGNGVGEILRHTQKDSQAKSVFETLRITQTPGENSGMDTNKGNAAVGGEIRRRRKALGMTLEELAFQIGGDNGNLSRLERGKQGYSDETLRKIAQALGCSVADLFSGAERESNVTQVPLGTRRIPLVSYVQAGHMTEAVDPYALGDADEWMLTDLDLSANAFALKIKGDSMLPEFREGDTVIIDPLVPPLPGDYVVAKNGENEATFKKYRPRGMNEQGRQVFELVPLNEDYPSMRSDLTHIHIIGTMVEHRRYRKR